jgi:hypothetical protein
VEVAPTQGADNPAMVMSLIASLRAVSLIPAYLQTLMPWSVVSRPLDGDAPTIDMIAGWLKVAGDNQQRRRPDAVCFLSATTSQSASKYTPTQGWLPLVGDGHPWMCKRKFRSRFQAISRDLLTEADVLGHP